MNNNIPDFSVNKPLLKKCSGITAEENEKNWRPKLLGICLSLFSCFSLITLNTIVQKLKLHFADVLFARALLQSSVGLFLSRLKGESVWIKEVDACKNLNRMRWLLFLFGFMGAAFNTSDLIAISYMPLGDAMTIIMSSVLPTMILAAIFLKDRLRLYKIFCSILVVSGIVLVLRPPFLFGNSVESEMDTGFNVSIPLKKNRTLSEILEITPKINSPQFKYYNIGAIAALAAMLSSAAMRTVMKMLVQNKSTSSFGVPLFYNSFANLMVALVLPVFRGNQRILFPSLDVENYDVWQWVGLASVAIIGVTQYSTRFMAIKLISPTLVGFIRTSEIVLAYAIQLVVLDTKPDATSLIGSGLVMVACIGVIFENWAIQKLNRRIKHLF